MYPRNACIMYDSNPHRAVHAAVSSSAYLSKCRYRSTPKPDESLVAKFITANKINNNASNKKNHTSPPPPRPLPPSTRLPHICGDSWWGVPHVRMNAAFREQKKRVISLFLQLSLFRFPHHAGAKPSIPSTTLAMCDKKKSAALS